MVSLCNLSYSSGKVSKWRRELAEQHYHYWRNMGQGLWTWVKASVSWMETWRFTTKTEISPESISCKVNGNFGLWCPGSDFVPHSETVNAQYLAAYLQNHLRRAVRRKQPQLQNVITLHDNSTPHKAICGRDLLRRWRWEGLEHPPYSPDLLPWDYDLIPKLKAPLHGHRFRTRDDIAIAVRCLIMTNFSHGEADGICQLPHHWQRTIDSLGDYFEGL